MMKRSGWILLFLGFWAWRLSAETRITFPKDTELTARAQTAIVEALENSCQIAIDFASLTLVNEVRRENPEFDLFILTFNVQFEDSQRTDQIFLRVRDERKKRGGIEVFDVHSTSGQCYFRGIFLTEWFNNAAYEFEPWMQGLQSVNERFAVNEMEEKFRFKAYDSKDYLTTAERMARLIWRDIYGVSDKVPFPCGPYFKGEFKSYAVEDSGYRIEGEGTSIVDTCYDQEIGKDWYYSVYVELQPDFDRGVVELKSSRKSPEEREKKKQQEEEHILRP